MGIAGTISKPPATPWRRALSLAIGVVAVMPFMLFLRSFEWNVAQWTDAYWPAAIALWATAVMVWPPRTRATSPWQARDFAPLAALLMVFAAVWLPFYDNWRWAFTGDSFGIFTSGYWFGKNGPIDSVLSVRGIDNFYTRLWELAYNWLMYVVEPTLFWHRVGQLVMACLGLSAMYTFYCLVLGRWWAAAIAAAMATNYVFVWISYISYQRTDSFVFYFLTLTCGLLLWRTPERLGVWLVAGLVGGLSLLFTPIVWGAVAWVALIFGTIALVQRRFAGVAVYTVSFLLAATPMLLEIPWMLEMLERQALARGGDDTLLWPTSAYLWSTFSTIVWSAYDSPIYNLGVAGAFLRYPLGHLYLAGLAFAVLAIVPALRRALRIPVAAPLLLGLLLADALLFALTNKGYGLPSHKRFYNLVALQVFFAILPLYLLSLWAGIRDRLRLIPIATLAAIGSAAAVGFALIENPKPHTYGHNVFDGLIEMRQRFADRDLVLFTNRPLEEPLAPDSLFQISYGIADRLTLVKTADAIALASYCARGALFCYEANHVAEAAEALLAAAPEWQPIEVINSFELRCAECRRRAAPPLPSAAALR